MKRSVSGAIVLALLFLFALEACAPSETAEPTAILQTEISAPSTMIMVTKTVGVAPTQNLPGQNNEIDVNGLFGSWVVLDVKFANIIAMTPEEAKTWIGKEADILHDAITFDRFSCNSPVYSIEILNASEYFSGYKVDPSRLDITQDEIRIIETNCDSTPFRKIVLLENGQLIFSWDGVFFFLEKMES